MNTEKGENSSSLMKMVEAIAITPQDALQIIKDLFKKIGITFTQKAAAKVIPFGIGVIIGGTANYALTTYVGKTARDTFRISLKEEVTAE